MHTPPTGEARPLSPARLAAALPGPLVLTREVLAGTLTTLALIPEVISFSFVSGVDPRVALFASVVLALVMSVLGGRPAMVTAAAGSVALVIGPMVRAHGVGYVLPAMLLAGLIQIGFGAAGLARLTRFIPRSVMIGFLNALGILIFAAQVPHVIGQPWAVYPLFALTLAIVLLLPRLTTVVPAALAAIVVVTAVVMAGHIAVPHVAEGPVPAGLPGLTPLTVPLGLETLRIVWPTAVSAALVGLLETLLTAKVVDEMTETPSHKNRESWALGVANICAGLYGGIGGCAMIGQSIVNVKVGGGRTRLSTIAAGLVLLALMTALSGLMGQIPMVALAAVMMIVALSAVNWHSLHPRTLRRMPLPETGVMLLTVGATVYTGNLAVGVFAGVLLAMLLFARRVAHVIRAERSLSADGAAVRYDVYGPLFFGSSNDLVDRFHYAADPAEVVIDLTHAQIWDASTVAALDAVETKYRNHGATVRIAGLDARSTAFRERLAGIV